MRSGFEAAGFKKLVQFLFCLRSINQYKSANMMQQNPALYKHHVGVAYIFEILKYGRKKYPAAKSKTVNANAWIKRVFGITGFVSSKKINVRTMPLKTIEVCAAFPFCALTQFSHVESFTTCMEPIA